MWCETKGKKSEVRLGRRLSCAGATYEVLAGPSSQRSGKAPQETQTEKRSPTAVNGQVGPLACEGSRQLK